MVSHKGSDFNDDIKFLIDSDLKVYKFVRCLKYSLIVIYSTTLKIKKIIFKLLGINTVTGSRSTFDFPSRVNLSGPSLYCT